jgi:hypothetical protein
MIQDLSAALRTLFMEDPTVNGLTGDRVYVEELPEAEHGKMPRACIVIVQAGGLPVRSWEPYQNPRYDIFCYGKDRYEAGKVDRAVTEKLHNLDREVVNSTLLHVAVIQGARAFKAGDTGWPVVHRSINLIGSNNEA